MKLTKENLFQYILFTVVAVVGVLTDFFLSLKAYQVNSERFVLHEANREIVAYFHYGQFPFFFYFTLIFFVIFLYFCFTSIEKYKDFIFIKEYEAILFGLILVMSLTRVAAGMTWFYSTHIYVAMFQIFSFMMLGALGCLAILMVRKKKEEKNESKNIC